MKDYIATIVKNEKIAENIYAVTFLVDEDIKVRCGQFGDISVGGTHLLRRPIAICKVDGREITFCYQIKGEGTQKLKTMVAGTRLNVLMPLGNGFFVEEEEKKIALVGGGVGVFPLISVLREYYGEKIISAYIGYRNKDAVCGVEEFQKATRFVGVTDDGSYGEQGFVTAKLQQLLESGREYDEVLAIGPVPMMKFVCKTTEPFGVHTSVSLNPIMVDGTGMCGGCRVTVGGEVKFACVDGPEFDGHKVDFAELMSRNSTYRSREADVKETHACRMEKMGKELIK